MGMVSSRECPYCGHHEVGFLTEDGAFHPLKPGTPIRIFEPPRLIESRHGEPERRLPKEAEERGIYRTWVPAPLRADPWLRTKYGIMVKEGLFKGEMPGGLYEIAYLEKIEGLIEKVLDTPLPVILNRFFSAPHLASGNPRQIAQAMYRDLDEVRRPVMLMRAWLERRGEESFSELIKPKSIKDLGHEAAEDETVKKDLEGLTLEEFLDML